MEILYLDKDPVKFARSTSILKDEVGNLYHIYITGPTKTAVREFITNELESGNLDLKIEIMPLETKPETVEPRVTSLPPATLPDLAEDEELLSPENEIHLGISRIFVNEDDATGGIPKPYRIVYKIDPRLRQGQSYTIAFEDPTIEVQCDTSQGHLSVKLLERKYAGMNIFVRHWLLNSRATDPVPLRRSGSMLFTGDWRVHLRGVAPISDYDVDVNRDVF